MGDYGQRGLEQIALSAITVMKLYQGMSNKIELGQLKRKIKYYNVVEIDIAISKLATNLMENFKLSYGLQILMQLLVQQQLFTKFRFTSTIPKILTLCLPLS
ncbi:MAG: type toxin-antitoxin system VapC family toxin [Mucilaginibacter sp.]|nr:type toxin-antitoxin system VapC family toxin [Mucilaginibacter sp.]